MKAMHVRGLFTGLVILCGPAACSYTEGALRPDPGMKEVSVEGVTFRLWSIGPAKGASRDLTPRARQAYPALFSPALSSVPLNAGVECKFEEDGTSLSCESRVAVVDREGRLVESEPHAFRFVNSESTAEHIYKPFFQNDIPDHLVETARLFAQKTDPALLRSLYEWRKSRISEVTLAGSRFWVLLAFNRSDQASGFERALAHFHASAEAEDASAIAESVEIARFVNGVWVPRKEWVRLAPKPTSITARLSGGVPVAVEILEERSPAVTAFLSLGAPEDPREVRWSNHMIVEAKNATLGETLKGLSLAELGALQTQLERNLLGLSEKAGQLELRLQQKMVKNEPTAPEMELVPLYKQRISIFEALVATLKQASRFK